MQARGKHYLRFTGIIEVFIGVVSFALIFWVLAQDVKAVLGVEVDIAKQALWELVLMYGTAAFHILAGIVGVLFAGSVRKYKIHYFFGLCLIVLVSISFVTSGNFTMSNIIYNLCLLIVPVCYLCGAMKNKQSFERR